MQLQFISRINTMDYKFNVFPHYMTKI